MEAGHLCYSDVNGYVLSTEGNVLLQLKTLVEVLYLTEVTQKRLKKNEVEGKYITV